MQETDPFRTAWAVYWATSVCHPPTRSDTRSIAKCATPERNAELLNAETPLAGPPAAEGKRKHGSICMALRSILFFLSTKVINPFGVKTTQNSFARKVGTDGPDWMVNYS